MYNLKQKNKQYKTGIVSLIEDDHYENCEMPGKYYKAIDQSLDSNM